MVTAHGLAPWQRHSRSEEALLLRRARTDDIASLAAMKRRVESRAYAHLGTPEALAVRLGARCTAWHVLTLLGEGHLVLVAEVRGQLAGMAAAAVEGQVDGPVLRLHSAYVELTGHGVGRALTAARLEVAAGLGIERVVASCLVGADRAADRLRAFGLVSSGPPTPCPTFPGVLLSHWTGSVVTALERVDQRHAT